MTGHPYTSKRAKLIFCDQNSTAAPFRGRGWPQALGLAPLSQLFTTSAGKCDFVEDLDHDAVGGAAAAAAGTRNWSILGLRKRTW
jgi:hypothetical protein